MRSATWSLMLCVLGACQTSLDDAALVIAHRGNSSVAPENTLAAVRSALALDPAPAFVEIDVHATADGALVVIHDKTLERTTTGEGEVATLNLVAVRSVDAGFPDTFNDTFAGERVPLLEEVLDLAEGTSTGVMIEVKAPGIGSAVATLVADRGELATHVIASFRADVLADAGAQQPQARLLYLIDEPDETAWETAAGLGLELLGVNKSAVDANLIDRAHEAGYGIWVWTVDDMPLAATLTALGADGIITNRPADLP